MKRAAAFAAAVLLAGLLAGCDLFGSNENFDVPPERLVVLTAVYDETIPGSDGAPVQRIVLVDFEDPSNYKVVTRSDDAYVQARFSPGKARLLFRDETVQFEDAGEPFIVYDLERNDLQPIFSSGTDLIVGRGAVWNAEGTGFYFRRTSPFIPPSVFFHRLGSGEVGQIQFKAFPVALKGQDSIIVFSNTKKGVPPGALSGKYEPFYFLSPEGYYLAHIDNPHLEFIYERRGVAEKAAYSLAWNDKRKLLAFAYSNSAFPGYKIAVTNLDGSYYREYTTGNYIDDHPRWGPDGEFILFDRRGIQDYEYTDYRTMLLNLETGQVREFVEPEVIDGAVALRFPDY